MKCLDWMIGDLAHQTEPIVTAILEEVNGRSYTFSDETEFSELLSADLVAGHRLYWSELLGRAHWAAVSNLFRHQTWLESCKINYAAGNLLGFAASLRGLVEAGGDTCYSLDKIAPSLASDHSLIQNALNGQTEQIFYLAPEVEDLLIHFHYGRKLLKGEVAPTSHNAETASRYLEVFSPADSQEVKALYSFLCQLVHPAAHSLWWSFSYDGQGTVAVEAPSGKLQIEELCLQHHNAIASVAQISLNTSLIILKVLDRFNLPAVCSTVIRSVDLSNLTAWQGIREQLEK